ncbi:MAG: 6-bladed beta-propeller [Candidatus Aminicenantes bacterium]|nr:MAG: 6-bladed beta-propeller [Candidatus Aminicenantes bacterium]
MNRKGMIGLIAMLLITANIAAELKIIENPGTPPGENAGRVIIPKEMMRITDESEDFYFKQPRRIKIAPDESIFLVDENQFLRFDKKGKFLNNQQKKGQGPGEYTYLLYYQFMDNKIYIFGSPPYKLVETDMQGNLLKETRLTGTQRFRWISGFVKGKDKFWFISSSFRAVLNRNTGEQTLDQELAWGTLDGKIEKTGILFPETWYMVKGTSKDGVRARLRSMVRPIFVRDQSNLYVSNTQKYLVQRVDLEEVKAVHKFNRKYTSVPYKDDKPKEENNRIIGPEPEYFSDIQAILFYSDQLWILTSTVVKDKGVLVDVFTKEGKYIDNFYLKLPRLTTANDMDRKPLTLYRNFLFTAEEDDDGDITVVKYKL